jgi:hypothetical protein
MPASYPRRPRSTNAFIVTPYVPGPDGRLTAEIPSCCPAGGGSGEAGCRLWIERHRPRKTGPQHLLTVLRCCTHECAFTLYPPGYAPYRRQAVLRVAPDGQPIRGEGDPQQRDFGGTVFEAALDAKRGQPWARESGTQPPERSWGTQGRHLRLGARLAGVARDLSDQVRCSIATVLSVATLQLIEGARAVGYRGLGEAVCAVLDRLRGGARRARQLLLCGQLTGSWGEPLHWDADRQFLERSPFPAVGTEALRRA